MELAAAFRGRAAARAGRSATPGCPSTSTAHRLEVVARPPHDGAAAARATSTALRVFLDGSLLEVFADDGRAAITTRCYAEAARPELRADDGVDVLESAAWRLSPP